MVDDRRHVLVRLEALSGSLLVELRPAPRDGAWPEDVDAEVADALDGATEASRRACQVCGGPGSLRGRPVVATLCARHAAPGAACRGAAPAAAARVPATGNPLADPGDGGARPPTGRIDDGPSRPTGAGRRDSPRGGGGSARGPGRRRRRAPRSGTPPRRLRAVVVSGAGDRARPEDAPEGSAPDALAHLGAARALSGVGQDEAADGAERAACVAALRSATSPSRTPADHAARVATLRAVAAAVGGHRRADLSSLFEAALSAEAARRLAAGLAPHDHRLAGWMDGVVAAAPVPVEPTRDELDGYAAAAAAADATHALLAAAGLLRELVARLRRGEAAHAAWEGLVGCALALCAAAGSRQACLARRRTLVILWMTFRRRRPLVAAVLRRRLALHRARWPGVDH